MKIPRENQFIHRALFHEKLAVLFSEKKAQRISQKRERMLAFKTKSSTKDSHTTVYDSSQLSETLKREKSNWPFFFSFQEFVTDWIREIVIRPSKTSIILSATLYLVAIASTIQRREGDRSFRFLLNAKLPGYDTIYKETSWESFQEFHLKNFINNPFCVTYDKAAAHSNKFFFYDKNHNVDTQNDASSIDLEDGKLIDIYKEKVFIHLRSPWQKHIRKDFVGIFPHRPKSFDSNSCTAAQIGAKLTDNLLTKNPMSSCKPVKSLKNDCLPRFCFVPIDSHSVEKDCLERIVTSPFMKNDCIVFPWYRIDACNRASRTVFASRNEKQKNSLYSDSKEKSDTQQEKKAFDSRNALYNKENSREHKSKQNLLHLFEKKQLFPAAKKENLSNIFTLRRLHSYQAQSKILGLEYLFPFQTSRQRVYAQNDMIPFKLEAAYSRESTSCHLILQNNTPEFSVRKKSIDLQKKDMGVGKVAEKTKKEENTFLKSNNLFCNKNVYFFQKELRKLFYMYGFYPASHLNMFLGEGLLNSLTEKQGRNIKQNNKNQNVQEEQSSHFHAVIGEENEKNTKEHLSVEKLLKGETNSKNAVNTILSDDFSDTTSFYEKLIEGVSQQPKKDKKGAQGKKSKIEGMPQKDATVFDSSNFERINLSHDTKLDDRSFQKHKTSTSKHIDADIPFENENKASPEDLKLHEGTKLHNPEKLSSAHFSHFPSFGQSSQAHAKTEKGIWECIASRKDFTPEDDVSKSFEENNFVYTRLMSGYKFPDYTKSQTNALYTKCVLPQLFVSSFLTFSHSYLLDQAILRPLSITLPPLLPASFFQNLAFLPNNFDFENALQAFSRECTQLKTGNMYPSAHAIPKDSNIQCEYKNLSLHELKEVKDAFVTLGQDFQDYLSRPKDSSPAMRISPSLEDDDALKREDEQKEKRDDDRATTFERLQKIRRREQKYEVGKRLRAFAYNRQLAFSCSTHKRKTSNENTKANHILHPHSTDFASRFTPARNLDAQTPFSKNLQADREKVNRIASPVIDILHANCADMTPTEKAWVYCRLGAENMRSDRRHNFFGRKHLLTKRLIAHEQKEIRDQILKNSFSAPSRNILSKQAKLQEKDMILPTYSNNRLGAAHGIQTASAGDGRQDSDSKISHKKDSVKKHLIESGSERFASLSPLPPHQKMTEETAFASNSPPKSFLFQTKQEKKEENALEERKNASISYRRLQRRARKGYLQLLGSLEFSAHQTAGIKDRTRKAHRALRGKTIKSAYSHLRWQKKRFRSRMLGTPCKRHFVMPEITQNDWKKILEWQLKNYLFLEEKRLQPLIQENSEKRYKIRQLDVYLPWITIRSASHAPFQWPYTRLDNIEYAIPPQVREKCCSLPLYTSPLYWDSGKSVSISQSPKIDSSPPLALTSNKKKSLPRLWGFLRKESKNGVSHTAQKVTTALHKQNGIRKRITNEPFLCERYNSYSYLLLYRLLLLFACKHLFQYIYRVSLKRFLLQIVNTDSGLMLTSPEFREWLENAPPKSLYTSHKRLKDVTIREDNIPILSETLWYLRNSGRSRKASQGLLLIGPPASEKTSLLQAIAGECGLPIVLQSMGALALTYEEPYEQLENAFSLARKNAPCVLFLDDLDAIGQSRRDVLQNDAGAPDLLLALDTYTREGKLSLANSRESFATHLFAYRESTSARQREGVPSLNNNVNSLSPFSADQSYTTHNTEKRAGNAADMTNEQSFSHMDQEFQTRRINLLLRLLTEMDGIVPLNGIVVVATSEQPALLDPALLRAGRFEGRIHLGLPDQERRIQLFKKQTQRLGHMQAMPWDYLGVRTRNMGALDIAAAINHSAIRAVLDNTVHTIETLEHGLRCVASLPKQAVSTSLLQKNRNDPFHSSRLAFFQAGKAVVHHLLLDHPQLAFCGYDHDAFSLHRIPGFSGIEEHSLSSALQARQTASQKVKSHLLEEKRFKSDFARKRREKQLFALKFKAVSDGVYRGRNVQTKSFISTLKGSGIETQHKLFFTPSTSKDSKGVQDQKTERKRFTRTRIEFESRLIGLYAGKAAELLHLSSSTVSKFYSTQSKQNRSQLSEADASKLKGIWSDWGEGSLSSLTKKSGLDTAWLWQSHLGFSELLTATLFIHAMIDRWYLYSPRLLSYKTNQAIPSSNQSSIQDENVFPTAQRLSQQLDFDLIPNARASSKTETDVQSFAQKRKEHTMKAACCQANICQALEMTERVYGKWYRIYLPQIEEGEQNEEWLPPDPLVHEALSLHNLSKKERVLWAQEKSGVSHLSGGLSRSSVSRQLLNFKEMNCSSNKSFQKSAASTSQNPHKNVMSLESKPIQIESYQTENTNRQEREEPQAFCKGRLTLVRLWYNSSKQTGIKRKSLYKNINDLYLLERDKQYQNLVLDSFYTAFRLCHENRELLDLFADHLLRFHILRSHEMEKICQLFFKEMQLEKQSI